MLAVIITLTDDPLDPPGDSRGGGAHLFMFDLARYLVRNSIRTVLVTRKDAAGKEEYVRLSSLCALHRLPVGPPADVDHHGLGEFLDEFITKTKDVLRQLGQPPDVLHSSSWLSGEVARVISGDLKIRHIHSVLSLGRARLAVGEEAHPADSMRDDCERRVFQHAETLICVCDNEKSDLVRLYPEIDATKIAIIPYGVDENVFYPRPTDAADHLRRAARRFAEGVDRFS